MAVRSGQTRRTATQAVTGFRAVGTRRAFEEILLQVEEAIESGRLAAGDRLPPERDLAGQFQVGRSSLREALRALEAFGVVTARRGSGAQSGSLVGFGQTGLARLLRLHAALGKVPMGDLLDVRLAIETMSVQQAAELGDAAGDAELKAILDAMGQAEAIEEFLDSDTGFHLAIAHLSGDTVAALMMEALREATARQMLAAFLLLTDWPTERQSLVSEHREIARAIAAGDGEAAVAATIAHIRSFYGRVLEGDGT